MPQQFQGATWKKLRGNDWASFSALFSVLYTFKMLKHALKRTLTCICRVFIVRFWNVLPPLCSVGSHYEGSGGPLAWWLPYGTACARRDWRRPSDEKPRGEAAVGETQYCLSVVRLWFLLFNVGEFCCVSLPTTLYFGVFDIISQVCTKGPFSFMWGWFGFLSVLIRRILAPTVKHCCPPRF